MTAEIQKKYDAKVKRMEDAIALREPDQVPINPPSGLYPVYFAGYTVAEVIYDTSLEKATDAAKKYLTHFDPDSGSAMGSNFVGEGPALEMNAPKNLRWAGMPGDIIDRNSIQQFIEYPLLLDNEFEEFFSDRTGWVLHKKLPRTCGLLEPFAGFRPSVFMGNARATAAQLSTPEFRKMIQQMWAMNDFYTAYSRSSAAMAAEIRELGYPEFGGGGGAAVPFDDYSDNLRGTLLSLADLYENTEYVERYIEESMERTVASIRASKGINEGKHVFMALHKGMDGFMSREHYEKYYWKYLQRIICEIIDSGHVPYIFTEGKYNSRLDFLTDVPKGKVYYHFEDVDMAEAKKKLGGIACISGGFRASMLEFSTKQEVIDETKRILDICAPGGGFVFATSCGIGNAKQENVEAMFDTVHTYGKY